MALTIGTRVRHLISRSGASNETRRLQGSYRPLGGVVRGADISFGSTNQIASAGSAFGNIPVGQVVRVSGSPGNSREYVVTATSAAALTVLPAILATESAGAEIIVALA